MTVNVLAAGDDFITDGLIREALAATGQSFAVRSLRLPWPVPAFGPVAEVDEAAGSEEQLVEALAGQEVCVTQMAPLTRRVFEAAPDLRLVAVARGGAVNVNLEAARAHGVAVTTAPGRNARATAEHTLALMLAAMRRVPETDADLRAGAWRGDLYALDAVPPELGSSVVGVVGHGAIGGLVASMVRALGAEVLVHDPHLPPDGPISSVPLPELLERSDVLTLHARLTPETRGLIGRAELAALRPGAVVVNCARGGLLDYDALCDALESGHLFGAAVDVFPAEPVPADARWLRHPRLVVTPHLAGASRQTAELAVRLVAQDIDRFLRGEPLLRGLS
jgi:D-3-phosphoglycerate dehydrogenase